MVTYDGKFYEARALWFYAQVRGKPLRRNVRLRRLNTPYSRRPEVDGVIQEEHGERAVEVKSYPVDEPMLRALALRGRELGFKALTIVAPSFETERTGSLIDVECVPFVPNVQPLRTHYSGPWAPEPVVEDWMNGGGIHFRYSTAEINPKNKRQRRTLNQTKKNIRTVAALSKEIAQRVLPDYTPVRVHWSPFRTLNPKDMFHRARRTYVLGGAHVFDIDGLIIHQAMFPCTIDPITGLCADCISLAKQHALRLVRRLRELRLEPVVFFSGHAGFHVYIFDEPAPGQDRLVLSKDVVEHRVLIDRQIASKKVPIIAFPTSVHGYSMRRVMRVDDLPAFHLKDSTSLGTP
jgi:hypothetical protein